MSRARSGALSTWIRRSSFIDGVLLPPEKK